LETNVIEEESDTGEEHPGHSLVPSSVVFSRIHTEVDKTNGVENKETDKKNRWKVLGEKMNHCLVPPIAKKRQPFSSTVIEANLEHCKSKRKNMKIKSNVACLTKMYARYLFVSANLNKDKDQFSGDHFFRLIQ
jgi:hypothetical protein